MLGGLIYERMRIGSICFLWRFCLCVGCLGGDYIFDWGSPGAIWFMFLVCLRFDLFWLLGLGGCYHLF